MVKITHQELEDLVREILERRGVADSETISRHFVEAELRGHSSHGVQRLVPLVKGVELGTIRREVKFNVLKEDGNSLLVDGMNSVGISLWNYLVENEGRRTLIAVRNASHIGFLGFYTEKVARMGKVGIMIGNAEPAVVKPNSSRRVLSTTPLSISIPFDPPVVLDMSLASIARGKIIEALRRGEEIPHGVAVDREGKITTHPGEALEGGILPLGGEKGFHLMVVLELLVGFMTGSAVGPQVKGVLNTENPSNKGEFLILIDPPERRSEVMEVMREVAGTLPGHHGLAEREERTRNGIEMDDKLLGTLREMRVKVPYFV